MNQEELKRHVRYDPETGLFYRLSTNTIAGCKDSHGYVVLKVGSKMFKAHRLAFLYMLGKFPKGDVDHVNMQRADNRWVNIREATRRENNVNLRSRPGSSSKFLGVSFSKTHGKWVARIRTPQGRKLLGYFDCEVAAAMAYHRAAKGEHGDFARGNPEAVAAQ